MQLHRACAYVEHSEELLHATVFFETEPGKLRPASQLRVLLSSLWRVPADDIDVSSVASEQVLIARSKSPPEHGDARLFEFGRNWDKSPFYERRENTLFLVRSAVLARLVAGQDKAESLRTAAAIDAECRRISARGVPA